MEHDEEGNMAWGMVVAGKAAIAVPIFERLIHDNPHIGDWNNYGTALMVVEDYRKAESMFRQIRKRPCPMCHASMDVGAAIWCHSGPLAAVEDWKSEIDRILNTELKLHDASGLFLTSLIWWASRYLQDESIWKEIQPRLKRLLKLRHQQNEWGMTLTGFIQEKVSQEALLFYAAGGKDHFNPGSRTESSQLAEVIFYIAGTCDVGSEEWIMDLQSVIQLGTPSAIHTAEYQIAKFELQKFGALPDLNQLFARKFAPDEEWSIFRAPQQQ